MDNVCEKINNLQVIEIKGNLPGNPSNELPHLALRSPPVARANGGVVDAGDGGGLRVTVSLHDTGVGRWWSGWL